MSTAEKGRPPQELPVQNRPSDQPNEATLTATKPEKINDFCKKVVEAWDCESSDHIKGCGGRCIHAINFLVEVSG
jgi:hypothetical protein